MKTKISALIPVFLALLVPSEAAPIASCKAIDAVISANEDFVEIILGSDISSRAEAQKKMQTSFTAVIAALAPDVAKQVQTNIGLLNQAVAANQLSQAALGAMENYGILVNAFEKRLPTTREVAMLDHAGFKLHALLAADPVDWTAIGDALTKTEAYLKITSTQLDDKAIQDMLATLTEGLANALQVQNKAWEHNAAQILLDSVDLIERKVKNQSKQACN
jgi:hypothetical protein